MKTLFWGTGIFFVFFAAHLALWRIRLPRRQVKTIMTISFGVLILSLALLARTAPDFALYGVRRPENLGEFFHIFLFVATMIVTYVITYVALEADSPSLVMVKKVQAAGASGLPQDEFERSLNDELLVLPRIKDLLTDKMARIENGRYLLLPKGKLLARIFIFYRGLLGLGMGG